MNISVNRSRESSGASRFVSLSRPTSFATPTAVSTFTSSVKLALHTLGHVLRNSLLYVAVGWFFGYCFTLGNVFTGLPPSQQSYAAFSAANISWFWGVFSACMIVIMSAKLLPDQFVGFSVKKVASGEPAMSMTRRLNLLQCVRKLLASMTPHLLLGATGAVWGDYYLYSTMPVSWSKFKPILYIAAFWGFYSMVIADVYARRIFQMETVRGIVASGLKSYPEKQSKAINASKVSNKIHSTPDQRKYQRCWTPSPRRFLRVYRQNLPVVVFALIAIVYVHVLSQFVHLTGRWGMFAFACISIILKLMLQELAKHIMISVRRPVSRRVMVALISTPTILVDTQVRMLLLRLNNLNISVAGTVLLAVLEIVVRTVKSVIVERQMRKPTAPPEKPRWRPSLTSVPPIKPIFVVPVNAATHDRTKSDVTTRSGETSTEYKTRRDAEERRRKLRRLHAGEIYADMYAEYIAIGCSYAILFFYRNHPQYEFSILLPATGDQTSDSSGSRANSRDQQLLSLGILQMTIEVLVDFLACVLEASQGVEFKSFNQNDPFLIFFLVMLTFSNVAISAGMYLR